MSPLEPLIFTPEGHSGKARAGVFSTHHGDILTPAFMPVGTRASVKTLWPEQLEEMNQEIILANTYHLLLRPGPELIEKMGGLHKFMSWDRPILTDSGGFQVFSLSKLNKISEEGVHFSGHLDGKAYFIGPHESMQIQKSLGADIVMAFDDCPPLPCSPERLQSATMRTISWAKKCREVELQKHQYLMGIIQGGLDLKLRLSCLEQLQELEFSAYAIGGLSVGEKTQEMYDLLEGLTSHMPVQRPRYLMGVGAPINLVESVFRGVDIFDCVLPTRNGRNGQALTNFGELNLKNKKHAEDAEALDPLCQCRVCRRFSRAYIRHLVTVKEPLGGQLLSYHNLFYLKTLMNEMRTAILNHRFDEYRLDFYTKREQAQPK